MPDDKRKINAWIPVSLYDKIEPAGYENTTQAIITALQRLLEDPQEDITGYKQDIEGYKQDIAGYLQDIAAITAENTQLKGQLQDTEGYRKDLIRIQKDIEKQNQDISGYKQDITRLKEDLAKAPDRVEFTQLQARYEGLQEIIRQKDEMIYILKQTNETLNTFAHYFKSMEVKQIGAQESKPAAKTEDRPAASKEENKPAARTEETGQQIEKICKNCLQPFFTENPKKKHVLLNVGLLIQEEKKRKGK